MHSGVMMSLHVAPILSAYFEQRIGNLPKRTNAHGVHQYVEDVLIGDDGLLQAFEHGGRGSRVQCVEVI